MKPLAQNTLIQNRYLIVQLIGKGGMGEVYLAVDQRLGSAIALKRTFFAGDEALGSAFEREARVLARMRHPVLPKVSDHFGEGDEQFLVMEHISGDDLSKRIEAAQKPFPVSWVMFWADQLLDALSYLHSHEPPIIHRDIKPQNLKLTDENHIILLDFGLAKSSTGQTNLGPNSTGSTGSVVGYTPHYAPMEQIRGIGTSARSDLYSLSATLYQLLTNSVPIDALSRADTMLNGQPDPVQPINELNPEVPQEISNVILHGMEVSQEKRFETAREMQKTLRRAYSDMQNAMSAKTMVISGGVQSSDLVDSGATTGNSEPFGIAPIEPAEALEPDFGATLVLDQYPQPQAIDDFPQQAGIKTEVFIPGAIAYTPDIADDVFSTPEVIEAEPELPDFGMTNAYSTPLSESGDSHGESSNFEPNATVPIIAFDPASSGSGAEYGSFSPQEQPSGFHTVAVSDPIETGYGTGNDDFNHAAAASTPINASLSSRAAKKKGGTGKVIGILAVLFLLVLIGTGGAAGVWYYMNYVAVTLEPTPTPTPLATPEVTPAPSPSQEPSPSPSVTPSPSPTAEATVTPRDTEPSTGPGIRPGQTIPRPTPTRNLPGPTRPPATPAPRPTPRRTPLQ